MDPLAVVLVDFVLLTTLDGRVAYVNPRAVMQITEPRSDANQTQLTPEVNCIISLRDGSFVTVRETCDVIRKLFVEEHQ